MRALSDQSADVAVEGAQRNTEFFRQSSAAHRMAVTAQELDEIEQTLRAGHGLSP
jgi:hypothetical protein